MFIPNFFTKVGISFTGGSVWHEISHLKAYEINQRGNTGSHSGSNLNLARLINLSVGISYPLGKQTSLSIEPFLKFPLKGIGTQQLHLGYGGINLNMSF